MTHQQKSYSQNRTNIFNQQTTVLPNTHEEDSFASLKDSLISLEFRIKTIQTQLNSKMEREQCLTLMERKSNILYVKKGFEQIYQKIQNERLQDQTNIHKFQEQQRQKIKDLQRKLKEVSNTRQGTELGSPLSKDHTYHNNFMDNFTKKINKAIVKPQQLYLESNETMFSMLIDEIKDLKQRDSLIERLIESKHKKTISLNNEVCRKLEHLQADFEQTIRYIDEIQHRSVRNVGKKVLDHSSIVQLKKPSKKSTTKSEKHHEGTLMEIFNRNPTESYAFENVRLQMLSKSIENLQKQLTQKLNIKDVIPFIKQSIPNFEQSVKQIKTYVDENFESMHKILSNQSQINEQISKSNRIGWWHCYQKLDFEHSERSTGEKLGYILFGKQMINIVPEVFVVDKDEEHTMNIMAKGWYVVQVYDVLAGKGLGESTLSKSDEQGVWLEINNGIKYPFSDKKLVNLAVGSSLRIITTKEDIFFQIQQL